MCDGKPLFMICVEEAVAFSKFDLLSVKKKMVREVSGKGSLTAVTRLKFSSYASKYTPPLASSTKRARRLCFNIS
jgi:hypothetical protein